MSVKKLKEYIDMDNIADSLDDEQLRLIGQHVLMGYDEDKHSMTDWLSDAKKVTELASLKATKKTTPLPTSANIKVPVITKAMYEFSSRIMPEIIKDGTVVMTKVLGDDFLGDKRKQANRVEEYMNYQLLFIDDSWEQDLDKILALLPLIGFVCKKTYFDPVRSKIKSEICEFDKLIINAKSKNLEEAERISHEMSLSLNECLEFVNSGLYLKEPIDSIIKKNANNELRPIINIIEQHCYLDLDEDNYAEPYIVTILKDSGEVLRVKARYTKDTIKSKADDVKYIDATQYFTDYHFLPSPKGDFQSVGFGILSLHLNETINTLLNQIVDAGQLANLQGGYIDSRAKLIETGNSLHDPGELKKVKTANGLALKDTIHMFDFKEPSNVLYQTLGLLIATTKDLSSSTEVLSGTASTDNIKTGAILALQEEGRKVFTGIQKRIYRGLTKEFKKLAYFNYCYLDPNVAVQIVDQDVAVSNEDFDPKFITVMPIADPNLSSETARAAKAQLLAGVIQFPGVKPEKITERILRSTNIENPDELLMSDQEMQQAKQQPNPEIIKIQGDLEAQAQDLNIRGREVELKEKQFQLDVLKAQSEILLNRANALKAVAQADQAQTTSQTNVYDIQLRAIQTQLDHLLDLGNLGLAGAQMQQDQTQHNNEMNMRQQEIDNAQQQAQQDSSMASQSSQPSSSQ